MKDFISTAIIIKMKKKNIHADCADLYKVSGRTHSVDWLIECMTSYTKGQGKLPSKCSDSGLKEVIKCI